MIQTVRKKFAYRAPEAITQPPAPFYPIARGRGDSACGYPLRQVRRAPAAEPTAWIVDAVPGLIYSLLLEAIGRWRPGYRESLEAIADPDHEEHDHDVT